MVLLTRILNAVKTDVHNQTPRFWGTLYFLLIPVFASVYTFALPPYSFYDQSASKERSVKEIGRDVLHQLANTMNRHVKFGQTVGAWRIESAHPSRLALDLENEIVRLDVQVWGNFRNPLLRSPSRKEAKSAIPVEPWLKQSILETQLEFKLQNSWSLDELLTQQTTAHISAEGNGMIEATFLTDQVFDNDAVSNDSGHQTFPKVVRHQLATRILRIVFPANYEKYDDPDVIIMPIPVDVKNRLSVYADALQGFPPAGKDNFWRMLYLSIVTITTLGFGDILPLTTAARFAVGAEAIAGVLVIGLFLNSLSSRMAASKKTN